MQYQHFYGCFGWIQTENKTQRSRSCFLGDKQIRAAEKKNQKHPPGFAIKILKCAHVTLHHQNKTAPSHDMSITDWRARPPTQEWFPPSLLNHPFVQKALISIFKCSSVGRWSSERDADCEAISAEQRAGGVAGAFYQIQKGGFTNLPLLRKRKMTLLCISSRLTSGQSGVRPEGRQILYFLSHLSVTAKEKHWQLTGTGLLAWY